MVAISGYVKGDLPTRLLNILVLHSPTDQSFFFLIELAAVGRVERCEMASLGVGGLV